MSHRFQRIRQFNHAELLPYPSQSNPCRKVTVRLQHPLLVGYGRPTYTAPPYTAPLSRSLPHTADKASQTKPKRTLAATFCGYPSDLEEEDE